MGASKLWYCKYENPSLLESSSVSFQRWQWPSLDPDCKVCTRSFALQCLLLAIVFAHSTTASRSSGQTDFYFHIFLSSVCFLSVFILALTVSAVFILTCVSIFMKGLHVTPIFPGCGKGKFFSLYVGVFLQQWESTAAGIRQFFKALILLISNFSILSTFRNLSVFCRLTDGHWTKMLSVSFQQYWQWCWRQLQKTLR